MTFMDYWHSEKVLNIVAARYRKLWHDTKTIIA